mgnify:CR=1 FL=1
MQLSHAVDEIKANAAVKTVILTGAGEKVFVAGGDIKSFPDWMGKGIEEAKQKIVMASSSFFRKNGARCVGIGSVSIGSGRQEIEEVLALYRQSEGLPSPRKSTMCLGAFLGRCILKNATGQKCVLFLPPSQLRSFLCLTSL